MKLENIKIDDEKGINAIEALPKGTVDKEIKGRAEYYPEGLQSPSGCAAVQFRIEEGLYSVNAPEGSSNFRATFSTPNNYARFVYKNIDYIFIDKQE
jgi:hypothetical protein